MSCSSNQCKWTFSLGWNTLIPKRSGLESPLYPFVIDFCFHRVSFHCIHFAWMLSSLCTLYLDIQLLNHGANHLAPKGQYFCTFINTERPCGGTLSCLMWFLLLRKLFEVCQVFPVWLNWRESGTVCTKRGNEGLCLGVSFHQSFATYCWNWNPVGRSVFRCILCAEHGK